MTVVPSGFIERFTWLNSRKTFLWPIRVPPHGPPFPLICGSNPSAALNPTALSSPSSSGPMRQACGPILVRAPTTTPFPITAKGPTSTSRPSRASGSTMAVGWMLTPRILRRG